jgi:hypothetical protein
MAEFAWREGARLQPGARIVPAQVVGETLDQLREANGGTVTPDLVLAAAADVANPLNPFFEWGDDEAARQFRLQQARGLLRSVVVRYRSNSGEPLTVRAFVSIKMEDGPRYTTSVAAMSDADQRAQVIRKAWNELQAFRKRYADLQEFGLIFATLDELDGALPPQIAA